MRFCCKSSVPPCRLPRCCPPWVSARCWRCASARSVPSAACGSPCAPCWRQRPRRKPWWDSKARTGVPCGWVVIDGNDHRIPLVKIWWNHHFLQNVAVKWGVYFEDTLFSDTHYFFDPIKWTQVIVQVYWFTSIFDQMVWGTRYLRNTWHEKVSLSELPSHFQQVSWMVSKKHWMFCWAAPTWYSETSAALVAMPAPGRCWFAPVMEGLVSKVIGPWLPDWARPGVQGFRVQVLAKSWVTKCMDRWFMVAVCCCHTT